MVNSSSYHPSPRRLRPGSLRSYIRPWEMARKHYTIRDNGLRQKWEGRIWLNPPYGDQTHIWLNRLAHHGNGIALTFARTETQMFFKSVWYRAQAIYFLPGRLSFYNNKGIQSRSGAGAPSCLIAYGLNNCESLERCRLNGKYIYLGNLEARKELPLIAYGIKMKKKEG